MLAYVESYPILSTASVGLHYYMARTSPLECASGIDSRCFRLSQSRVGPLQISKNTCGRQPP